MNRHFLLIGASSFLGLSATIAACSGEPSPSDSILAADASPSSVPTSEGSVDGGTARDANASADGATDGKAPPTEAGSDASVMPTDFGKSLGIDRCVPPGNPVAPAWVRPSRCGAATRQSPIVSTQTGAVVYSKDVSTSSATLRYGGETIFGSDGTIYANGETIVALDGATRATKWTHFFGSDPVVAVGTPDKVYLAGSYSISGFGGGTQLFATDLPHYVRSGVAVLADGSIAYQDGAQTLFVRDGQTGALSWSTDLGAPWVAYSQAPVVATNGTLYLARDTKIVAVSPATHQILWSIPAKAKSITLDEQDGRIYFIARDGGYSRVAYVSADDGSGLTYATPRFSDNEAGPLALGDNGWVYFAANVAIHGVQMGTANHWQTPVTSYAEVIVGGDGTVYSTDVSLTETSVSAHTPSGALRWKKLVATYPSASQRHRAYLSIAPTGHLAVSVGANSTMYLLGP